MVRALLQHLVLLASGQMEHRVWGRFDHQKPSFGTEHFIAVVGLVALLLLVAMAVRIYSQRSKRTFRFDSSARMFRELCAAHRLNRASRRLLQRLAAARGMKDAAHLFVEPSHFDVQDLSPDWKTSAAEVRHLRSRLFG
jgi:hypothetical protein